MTTLIELLKKIPINHPRALPGIFRRSFQQWTFYLTRKLNLKILTREEIFANSKECRIFQFGTEESIVLSNPANSSDKLQALTSIIGTHSVKIPFVFEVKNTELIGSTAVGFDREGNIISETVTGSPKGIKYISAQTLALNKLPGWGVPELDTVCSLVNWNGGYFHWIVDCLTRIEGVEHYQEQTGAKPTLIINPNPSEWQKASLRLLGYEPDDCIQWNESRIKVKRLVVSSFRRQHNIISPQACHWLRQRMLSNLAAVSSKNLSCSPRIYISRPRTAGRHVINENEVLAALTPLGFVAYTMEELSFEDEVRLFSQAEIVVAAHGAGLTNMIFASQKLIVIELFGSSADSFGTPCFFVLAQALGLHYGCLGSNPDPKKKREKYNGIMVDAGRLLELVEEMLSEASDRQLVSVGEILTSSSDRQLVSVEEALSLAGDQSANTSVLNSDDLVELQDNR